MDANYLSLAERMLDHAASSGAGLAVFGTHDPAMIEGCLEMAGARSLDRDRYEFDMLYGIGRDAQQRLLTADQPLRILISYGAAWFPWYMRRLAERPANVWFVLRNVIG